MWTIIKYIILITSIIIGIYFVYDIKQDLDATALRQELHRQALIEILKFLDIQYGR